MSEAYVETTVLTDFLLKPNSPKQKRAKLALKAYDSTSLPVYSIKEWKAGPLGKFAYVHDKLVFTQSLRDTLQAVSALGTTYAKSTSVEALAAAAVEAAKRPRPFVGLGNSDQDMADSYRLALVSLIMRSWRKRRNITTRVVDELACYVEAEPRIGRDGFFELDPQLCDREQECCLAEKLKSRPDLLAALRDAIPASSQRREDQRRRQALKRLINRPKDTLDRDACRSLGDAIFAFFCPQDAVVLTTNITDHRPLAESLGKKAQSPSELGRDDVRP